MPSPITRIYVATCRRDFHLARLCVASIRYWYPDIPITLLPDDEPGDFDFRPLLRDWKVDLFPTPIRRFGWGMSKLETLFLPLGGRFLVLDADLVLLGPVLDLLNTVPGDFVVFPKEAEKIYVERDSFVLDRLRAFDPSFRIPQAVFNSGQYVATGGLLQRSDFDSVLEWSEPRRVRNPEIFKCGEQGLFNYVLLKAEAAGRLTIGRQEFFRLSRPDSSDITVAAIGQGTAPPWIFHWAGYKAPAIHLMKRADILEFYARYERSRISWRSRFDYWLRDQSWHKTKSKLKDMVWLIQQWLKGSPFVFGGEVRDLPLALFHDFHSLEDGEGKSWYWSQPEASITVPLRPGSYRFRVETASPNPMTCLAQSHLRLYFDDREIPQERIHMVEGTAEFDLDPADFQAKPPHLLRLAIDRLPTGESEKRELGLPLSGLWIHRRLRRSKV